MLRRPVLRYFGGKWRVAPWIIEHFPAHRIYVEPFGGGASVLMRKERSYAEIYNDLDSEIVNVFRVMRNDPLELKRLLELTPFARDEFNAAYDGSSDPIEQARRTISRSFMGFGGDGTTKQSRTGFRAKAIYQGRHPGMDWINYPPQIEEFCRRLAGVVIENRPALEVMLMQDSPETLHYVDPPYIHSSRSRDKNGYRYEMTDAQHKELLAALCGLKGFVVLSGYESDLYNEALHWEKRKKETYSDGGRKRTECIWLSPRTVEALNRGKKWNF